MAQTKFMDINAIQYYDGKIKAHIDAKDAAALAVAANPGGSYNPLFIHGNSGLGKTHLLSAICHEIRKSNPDANIVYTRGETFTTDLIRYLAEKNMVEFSEYCVIDDKVDGKYPSDHCPVFARFKLFN